MTSQTADDMTITIGPRNSQTSPDGLRFYTWQGRQLVSVTTAKSMAGLPHRLHQWQLTQVVNRAIENVDDYAAKLAQADELDIQNGTFTEYDRMAKLVARDMRSAATERRDQAGKIGSAVHRAADTGQGLDQVPPEVRPKLAQYMDFMAKSGARILLSEFQVWNLADGYAGTADVLLQFPNGDIDLVDLKTGNSIWSQHAIQLSAYMNAEFVGNDDVVNELSTKLLARAGNMAILHLRNDGWTYTRVRNDEETWLAYQGILRYGLWMHTHPSFSDVSLGSRTGKA